MIAIYISIWRGKKIISQLVSLNMLLLTRTGYGFGFYKIQNRTYIFVDWMSEMELLNLRLLYTKENWVSILIMPA
jgi:hypothetical protein